jgi:hypothetical protein
VLPESRCNKLSKRLEVLDDKNADWRFGQGNRLSI